MRYFLTIPLSILLFTAANSGRPAGKEDIPPGKRPNIVFIMADSHRAEALGISKNPFVRTPHLDALANEGGTWFENTHVTTAICAVSRASILSGQHRARHKINNFTTDFKGAALEETYPLLLGKAGYKLAQIGFLGVGKNPPSDRFDYWEADIPWTTADSLHQTDHITEKAVAYLEKQRKDEPFYLAVSFHAAHEIGGVNGNPASYLVQERFRKLYRDIDIPAPASADTSCWNSFPDFFRTDQNIARARWHGLFSSPALFRENTRNYYRLVTGVDEAVGKIVAKLKSLGLDDNTVVIYTSDHGFALGEHGLMGKWYGFRTATHVPLIINDFRNSPGRCGTRNRELALNIDLAPTILALAGVNIPRGMQGHNLLQRGKTPARTRFFYEHTVFSSPLLPKVEGVITDEYRYFLYPEHNYEVLYDEKKDPGEIENVAGNPRYRKQLETFRKLYHLEKEAAR